MKLNKGTTVLPRISESQRHNLDDNNRLQTVFYHWNELKWVDQSSRQGLTRRFGHALCWKSVAIAILLMIRCYAIKSWAKSTHIWEWVTCLIRYYWQPGTRGRDNNDNNNNNSCSRWRSDNNNNTSTSWECGGNTSGGAVSVLEIYVSFLPFQETQQAQTILMFIWRLINSWEIFNEAIKPL